MNLKLRRHAKIWNCKTSTYKQMRILVLGGDGYLGCTSLFLSSEGHEVGIIDNMSKRQWELRWV